MYFFLQKSSGTLRRNHHPNSGPHRLERGRWESGGTSVKQRFPHISHLPYTRLHLATTAVPPQVA